MAEAANALQREALYHEARVLILINEFSEPTNPLRGLTKLAKLDFLLRYPTMTERLMPAGLSWPDDIAPSWDEHHAVESRMIRYKYGPWDDRYYPLLGALVGKALASFADEGRTFAIVCTGRGRAVVEELTRDASWLSIALRARFLRAHFDVSGNALKDLIYANLPDVAALALRNEI